MVSFEALAFNFSLWIFLQLVAYWIWVSIFLTILLTSAGVRQPLKSTFSSDIVKQTAGALYEGIHIIYQSIPLWRILFTDGPQAALVTERSMMFIRDVFIFLSPWYTSKKAKETKDKSVVALELQ